MDLRVWVMADVDAGMKTTEAAKRYRVSTDWIRKLKRFHGQTGSFAPRQQRVNHATKLDNDLPMLEQLVKEQLDATLKELRAALIAGLCPAGLSMAGLLGSSKAMSSLAERQETCAARVSLIGVAVVNSSEGEERKRTRNAPRRMARPIVRRLSPDFRARRCALAADECSDDDDLRLTIRISQGRGQRVNVCFPLVLERSL
jgi:hypothetical protein